MELVLLRHGRTAANAGGLLLGRADPALDAEGVRQAAAAGERLRALLGERRDGVRVVSSPLARCRATAVAVAATLDVGVDEDERWVELDYGDLDGTPMADVAPATWAAWRSDVGWRPPGGETLAELGARVRAACDGLDPDGPDVVVVTHVSPLKAAVAWALGVGDQVTWRMFVAPASITRIAVRPGATPSLLSFNDLGHLGR